MVCFDRLTLNYKLEKNTDANAAPVVEEDGKFYKTEDEIEVWFRKLEDELNWQRSITGDGCYIDPSSGEVC